MEFHISMEYGSITCHIAWYGVTLLNITSHNYNSLVYSDIHINVKIILHILLTYIVFQAYTRN